MTLPYDPPRPTDPAAAGGPADAGRPADAAPADAPAGSRSPGSAPVGPTAAAPAPARAPAPEKQRGRTALLLTVALIATLAVLALVSAGTGAYDIALGDVLASVRHHAGLGGAPLDRVGESVLWNVRLPRVVLALLVGASLGCAGALMQGVFGNPLAEPGVIGISAGAAVGAVAAIGLGLAFLGNWTVPFCAFVAGLITVGSVYLLSRNGGKTEVVTLILTGIAVNAFAGALIGLFVFFADSGQVNQITFWQLGSLAQATWPKVLAVLPCALVGLLASPSTPAGSTSSRSANAPPATSASTSNGCASPSSWSSPCSPPPPWPSPVSSPSSACSSRTCCAWPTAPATASWCRAARWPEPWSWSRATWPPGPSPSPPSCRSAC